MKSVQIRSFSGLYFPAFGLNTASYSVNFRIQNAGKYGPEKTLYRDTFHVVFVLSFASQGTCQYIELESAEIQNTKTSEAFLKRGESIENEWLLLKLSDMKVFFRIEGILSKTFLKKAISIVGIRFHFLGGCIRQITRQI